LFNIVRRKHDYVQKVLNSISLNISFRRNLVGANLRNWHAIMTSLHDLSLQEERDSFVWALHSSSRFSVRSMYAALINNGVRVSQGIWQLKILTRIKIFLWFLKKGVTLTKDNLARWNWNSDTTCCFCHSPETIQHIFWIACMPNFYGVLYTFCLGSHLQVVLMISLIRGLGWVGTNETYYY
jgi:hypothetical protein